MVQLSTTSFKKWKYAYLLKLGSIKVVQSTLVVYQNQVKLMLKWVLCV